MVSCNYYYYEVASRIGIDNIAAYARKFGLGEKTGIELFGEASGTVASRDYVQKLNERGIKKYGQLVILYLLQLVSHIMSTRHFKCAIIYLH